MPKTEAMYEKEQKIKMMAFSLVQNMQRLTLNLYHLPELRASGTFSEITPIEL